MLRLFEFRDGLIRELAADPQQLATQIGRVGWIDALEPSPEEQSLLSNLLGDVLPEGEEVEEIEASARCFSDAQGLHVHTLFLISSEGRHSTVSVAFILQPERLISVRDCEIADFRLFRMRAKRGQITSHSASELLIDILDQKVANHADQLEHLHRQLEKVSYQVLEDEDAELEEIIGQLARLEDSNGKVRLCLMDTQRSITFLLRNLKEHARREDLREVLRDVETLMSHTTFLFDKINFLMDSTQGFINIEQNQIIKIFSIAAVVFLPPTLVASIYGMNFVFLPEFDWRYGYPFALGLMVASGIAPYLFFKRKGWL